MEDTHDYPQMSRVWQRIAPQENPYPEIRKPSPCPAVSRELLREELRHTAAVLRLLEEALANTEESRII